MNLWEFEIYIFPNLDDPVQPFEKPRAFQKASLLGKQILSLIHKPVERIQDIFHLT